MATIAQFTNSTGIQESEELIALKASTFKRLHPRAYLERFLVEGYRPDGRVPSAFRDTTANVGTSFEQKGPLRLLLNYFLTGSITTADGSALVRLGETVVVCGVKAEIAEPELDQPEHGFLGSYIIYSLSWNSLGLMKYSVPNLDLPALCSPHFKPGPPGDEAQVLSERLNEALVTFVLWLPFKTKTYSAASAGTVLTESLCINPGRAVWVLYVDATCINYNGNVFDAALIAMVAALRNGV